MKEQDKFILDIKRLGINGEGIGFYNKLAVFVKNAIPGEGIDVEVTKIYPKMAIAKPISWKKTSPHRQNPICPYYEKCGACQVMHISNDYTKVLKRELLIEAIKRYTKLNPKQFEIRELVNMAEPLNYRNKSTSVIRKYSGLLTLTMIEEGSNLTFPIDKCLVLDPKINEINEKIIKLANEEQIKAYPDEKYSLRYLITRVAKFTRESLVCLVVYKYDDEIKRLANKILASKICDSLYININHDSKTHEIFGEESIYVGGKGSICEQLGKYKFNIYPTTFFQLNTLQTINLYDSVKKACKLTHREVVLDAFCGVGTIGIYISNLAKEVYGIEFNKESVEAAKVNAKINKVKNINFYQGNVTKLLPELNKKGISFDVCIVDPPRTGLGEEVINFILKNPIKRLVYVSCNMSTLAKDLNLLSQIYKINYIEPFDMFPQTSAVEAVVAMTLK